MTMVASNRLGATATEAAAAVRMTTVAGGDDVSDDCVRVDRGRGGKCETVECLSAAESSHGRGAEEGARTAANGTWRADECEPVGHSACVRA